MFRSDNHSKKKFAVVGLVVAALIGGSMAYALWSANGTGSGSAKALTAQIDHRQRVDRHRRPVPRLHQWRRVLHAHQPEPVRGHDDRHDVRDSHIE